MKNELKIAVPKDAAAVILLNEKNVLWARRNPALKFLGGWHAFPGGKLEVADAEIKVENCADAELAKFIVCAVREMFEEVGVLLARGGEKLTKGQFASLHDDLISGRMSFGEILSHWELRIDADDFFFAGFWTTPQFSPMRFKTRFFLAVCPPKQKPYAAISELENVEFATPTDALRRWKNSEVLISPPVLIALQELAKQENSSSEINVFKRTKPKNQNPNEKLRTIAQTLGEKSQLCDGEINFIELNSRVICFPLKTETLPPATHTNCFVVGKKEFVVVDAASKDFDEQNAFHSFIDSFVREEYKCQAIITTHAHPDHFGGESALQKHLLDKYGWQVPIAAHALTAESLAGRVAFDRLLNDNESFRLTDEADEVFDLKALHTPGHARGHLCFYDKEFGFLLSSDNVVGADSVIVAAPEGNMIDYLKSLEQMKNLPNLKFLCGSHGAAVSDAKSKIEKYIGHRLMREQNILEAIEGGAKTAGEIVEKVYADVPKGLRELAEKSVQAHIEKLKAEGKFEGFPIVEAKFKT